MPVSAMGRNVTVTVLAVKATIMLCLRQHTGQVPVGTSWLHRSFKAGVFIVTAACDEESIPAFLGEVTPVTV